MSLLNPPKPFLQTNAWQQQQANSLRYNTSQAGSVLPYIYGTTRQAVNLIDFGDYRGPQGKKGKAGPLPIQGQHVGKGGGGAGGKKAVGGKKNNDFSIDVAFALCQGPVSIGAKNFVWSSAGVAFFPSIGLNLYTGTYTQTADPVFVGLGHNIAYAGTCYVTGTPMDLGPSPALPNLSFEITGFVAGTAGPGYPKDANPAAIVSDFLTDAFHGVGFPSVNLDPNLASTYGFYCQAAQLVMSPALQVQTEAAAWLNELAKLTNTAIVWSGSLLKWIPYGDLELVANGATWTPNLVPEYSFNDNDFLPWTPHLDTREPQLNEDGPVLIDRVDPSDVTNWVSIEYLDRANFYNKNVVPQFDQGMIDLYGLKTEPSIQGNCFCDATPASISARLILQRSLYVRNKYKFQIGWQYMLLEPMDIVLITDVYCNVVNQPVRITSIEENKNGDFTVTAEEIAVGAVIAPAPPPLPTLSLHVGVGADAYKSGLTGVVDGPRGIFSIAINPEEYPALPSQSIAGLFRHFAVSPFYLPAAFYISYNRDDGSITVSCGGRLRDDLVVGVSGPGVVNVDGHWHNITASWDMGALTIQCAYDGVVVPLTLTAYTAIPFDCAYADEQWVAFSAANFSFSGAQYVGGAQDLYFNTETSLDLSVGSNTAKFWTAGHAVHLGDDGSLPTGSAPAVLLHYVSPESTSSFLTNNGTGGSFSGAGNAFTTYSSDPY